MASQHCALRYFLLAIIVLRIHCAPRSKNRDSHQPQTVYDQKQTGDYNIQLHLKDFQIIALLSDDSSDFGDYDYSYDYSDFTVKPITQKPTEVTPSTQAPPSSSPFPDKPPPPSQPNNHPYPIVPPVTNEPAKEPEHAKEPSANNETQLVVSGIEEYVNIEVNANTTSSQELTKQITSSTEKSVKIVDTNPPGKIKVQIIESPVDVSIVPGEDLHEPSDAVPQGEGVQLRKCATGFSRDKKGRCRRVRRPGTIQSQLPYGFSRLASNLASRFRQATSENSSPASKITED